MLSKISYLHLILAVILYGLSPTVLPAQATVAPSDTAGFQTFLYKTADTTYVERAKD